MLITYLEQSTDALMGAMLTAHLAGILAAVARLSPVTLAAADLRQPQAKRLSAGVLAAEARLLTP